jgi:hypothetical protein
MQGSTSGKKAQVLQLGGFECRFCFGIAGLHVAIQFQAVDHTAFADHKGRDRFFTQ